MVIEELCRITVDAAYRLHRDLGPGLLESVYEQLLAAELDRLGLPTTRQRPIDIEWRGLKIESAFRADLLVDDRLLIEIKSVERLAPVHAKQVITYLRLMHLPIGLLINFGGGTLKEGVRRLVNSYQAEPSRLRVFARNQSS